MRKLNREKITGKYILNADGEPVLKRNVWKWACWVETHDQECRGACEKLGDFEVSTVFLALDRSFYSLAGKPYHPESPVFGETIVV